MFRVRARSEVKFEARESVRVSLALKFADVAQQVEHNVANVEAMGSSPIVRTTQSLPTWWNWQTRQPEELVAKSYAGSSPAVGTKLCFRSLITTQ